MTTIINLFGSSGVGKSTLAAGLFAELKLRGKSSELVSEYVKSWAWEGRKPQKHDQIYFFGKQVRKESILYGKVDYIVTDSPIWLSGFYSYRYLENDIVTPMVRLFESSRKDLNQVNFFLPPIKTYDPRGRYETAEQSRANSDALLEFLNKENIQYHVVDVSEKDRVNYIINRLGV